MEEKILNEQADEAFGISSNNNKKEDIVYGKTEKMLVPGINVEEGGREGYFISTITFSVPDSSNTILSITDSGGTNKWVSNKDGIILISTQITWNVNDVGNREIHIWKNGAYFTGVKQKATSGWTVQHLSTIVNVNKGDYIEVRGWQDSGSTINESGTNHIIINY